MKTQKRYLEDVGVSVEASAFTGVGQVDEWHVMLHVEARDEGFEGQMRRIYAAEDALLTWPDFEDAICVMKRYFLTDSANQRPLMRPDQSAAVSIIQQPPLDGSKIAVWLYLVRGMQATNEDGVRVVRHGGYVHLWHMSLCHPVGDSAQQTEGILQAYETSLARYGANIADNCLRTWFFVRDVDTQYAGLVRARRENFLQQGLSADTHYIASTGIGGAPAETKALIQMGAYALVGLQPEQQRYLYARTHLNPTYEYGVTFERGTRLDFGDRRHVFISGTASIDNRGQVVHVGDVAEQTHRMWENVQTLLAEADTTWDDVAQMIVYLRDVADYALVRSMFAQRFPCVPTVITLAPVCRPAWLIEMECIAIKQQHNEQFAAL